MLVARRRQGAVRRAYAIHHPSSLQLPQAGCQRLGHHHIQQSPAGCQPTSGEPTVVAQGGSPCTAFHALHQPAKLGLQSCKCSLRLASPTASKCHHHVVTHLELSKYTMGTGIPTLMPRMILSRRWRQDYDT